MKYHEIYEKSLRNLKFDNKVTNFISTFRFVELLQKLVKLKIYQGQKNSFRMISIS